jgi:hypothetical protein
VGVPTSDLPSSYQQTREKVVAVQGWFHADEVDARIAELRAQADHARLAASARRHRRRGRAEGWLRGWLVRGASRPLGAG